jgi:hypothetical protein
MPAAKDFGRLPVQAAPFLRSLVAADVSVAAALGRFQARIETQLLVNFGPGTARSRPVARIVAGRAPAIESWRAG